MADLRSELRGAFQRRLDAAPMRPDLVARAAQRVAEPRPPRQPLALATALAVLLMVAVVATLLYVTTSQRSRSTPANHSTPAVSPSLIPSSAPSPVPARFQHYPYRWAYADAGFNPAEMPIASLTTCEAEVRLMGWDVARGHITAAPYFENVATPGNDSFVAKYKQRFGSDQPTNMCAEAAYFQVHVFAKALAETNTMDADILRPMVLGCEYEAPQGRIVIDSESNHTDLWTRIGRVGERGRFDILMESQLAVRPDPYLVSH